MPPLTLEFTGGLESLFDFVKRHKVNPPEHVTTLGHLIDWVKTSLLTHNHDNFILDDKLRPGILVLVNEVDWELEGTTSYNLKKGDCIAFISTLHGG